MSRQDDLEQYSEQWTKEKDAELARRLKDQEEKDRVAREARERKDKEKA